MSNMKILKYHVQLGQTNVAMPGEARVVHFGLDGGGNYSIWAEVTESKKVVDHPIVIAATGDDVPSYGKHTGSLIEPDGHVWHLYVWQDRRRR